MTPRRRGGPGKRSDGADTKERLLKAAIETLCGAGFSGASARAIAANGGVNQALVFYHFGSVNDLLLEALASVGRARMADYTAALAEVSSLEELVAAAKAIFDEDLDRGYVKVLSELISGASTFPELGPRIWQEIEPWVAFTEEAISRVAADSPLGAVVPVPDLAFGIVALYLGLELLAHLKGEHRDVDSLFSAVKQMAEMMSAFVPGVRARGDDPR